MVSAHSGNWEENGNQRPMVAGTPARVCAWAAVSATQRALTRRRPRPRSSTGRRDDWKGARRKPEPLERSPRMKPGPLSYRRRTLGAHLGAVGLKNRTRIRCARAMTVPAPGLPKMRLGLSSALPTLRSTAMDPGLAQRCGFERFVVVNKEKGATRAPFSKMAERTGLEPATPGVTGRYSNQLNYRSVFVQRNQGQGCTWWVLTGSNRRHSPCKGDALPTELSTR